MLSEKAIDDFIKIYKKEHGVEISRDEATDLAIRFYTMMKVVYRPIPKKNHVKS